MDPHQAKLVAALKASGLKFYWVAMALGVHRSTVQRWSNGHSTMPVHQQVALRALLIKEGVYGE